MSLDDPSLDARYLEIFPAFLRSLADDARALGAIVASDAPEETRRYAAAALNYVLKSLDLIPDGIDDLGFLDDACVLRVAAALAMPSAAADDDRPLARLAIDAKN